MELTKDKIYVGWYSNDEPYSQLQVLVKNDEEGNNLKQQILDDQEKAWKWDKLKTDLEKLGMTVEMKLTIEKAFASEFKDHLQNQKLRGLIEKLYIRIRDDRPEDNYADYYRQFVEKELKEMLDEK